MLLAARSCEARLAHRRSGSTASGPSMSRIRHVSAFCSARPSSGHPAESLPSYRNSTSQDNTTLVAASCCSIKSLIRFCYTIAEYYGQRLLYIYLVVSILFSSVQRPESEYSCRSGCSISSCCPSTNTAAVYTHAKRPSFCTLCARLLTKRKAEAVAVSLHGPLKDGADSAPPATSTLVVIDRAPRYEASHCDLR